MSALVIEVVHSNKESHGEPSLSDVLRQLAHTHKMQHKILRTLDVNTCLLKCIHAMVAKIAPQDDPEITKLIEQLKVSQESLQQAIDAAGSDTIPVSPPG